jgi:hypothetical protein
MNNMTRCLDCGSPRTADQCPACGLTSAAAEVMFRRRFMKRTGVFLAGSLAFPYISQIYPPLDLDLMLIFFGLVFFLVLAVAIILERRARKRQEIEILKHIFAVFIPLPWILAVTLFVNGRLDSQKNLTDINATVYSRYNMPGVVLRMRRLVVRSWRNPQKYERLAVDPDDYDRFKPGDQVVVAVEPGALGIPWYYGVYRR